MDPASSIKETLGELKKEPFVRLLFKFIGETRFLQNTRPELFPEEQRIINHVLDVLRPHSTANGGPLLINRVSYGCNSGNLIVEYPGTVPGKVVSFVGSHMDVVTADPDAWEFDPFSLSIEGDQLRGLGTTDCLGHVALLTEILKKLAETKLQLKTSVVVIFAASEEYSTFHGVGIDRLAKDGYFDKLKGGPLYWIDTADSQPCIGTGGVIYWTLVATGKPFHSGFPHKSINPIELAMEALQVIQFRFNEDFPPHPKEKVYGFMTPSTMTPTDFSRSYPNEIPDQCVVNGVVRLTPFYDMDDVVTKIKSYDNYINANVEKLETSGPVSKYVLPDEGLRGSIQIMMDDPTLGFVCDLDSRGYQVLHKATEEVLGYVKPYSFTATLPLIRDLQDRGYDVQAVGYGLLDVYHAKNEYCLFKDMSNGYKVFASIISQLEQDRSM